MILLLDNYDSFTYNLYQMLRVLTEEEVTVVRNDAKSVNELHAMRPKALVISPGSGRPEAAGVGCDAVRALAGQIPILGVGLGHLVIGAAFGARVVRAKELAHARVLPVEADGEGVFRGIENPIKAMCYHSLVLERESLPEELVASAALEDGEIMGVRHATKLVEGVQFHPESIMTPVGKRLMRNFLKMRYTD
jgi:anthranilate synthase/aminodeoxychorismate synthase-like glutamine amidotransferase